MFDPTSPSALASPGPGRRRQRWVAALLLLLGGAATAALAAAWFAPPAPVDANELRAAVLSALAEGAGPGSDPICVANGLAYDQSPVHVQPSNTVTVSWMNTLVAAGLYEAATTGAGGSGAALPPLLVYRPLPELAQWAGPRRLCIAKAVRLQRIGEVGRVEDMRLRGQRFDGVPADVVWTLEQPAPWLANPDVAQAFARELPTWRGARWQAAPKTWHLTQRKHFFRVDDRWVTSERAESLQSAAPPLAPAI